MHGISRWRRARTRAQSTLEYILVLAAILVACIIAATNLVGPAVETSMEDSSKNIKAAVGKVTKGLGL